MVCSMPTWMKCEPLKLWLELSSYCCLSWRISFAVCKNCFPSGVRLSGRLRTNSVVPSSSSSFAICFDSDCCEINRCFAAVEKLFSSATAVKLFSNEKSIINKRSAFSLYGASAGEKGVRRFARIHC